MFDHTAQNTQDLTARTFYRALDKLDIYEGRGLIFSTWFFWTAYNLGANWHRDRAALYCGSVPQLTTAPTLGQYHQLSADGHSRSLVAPFSCWPPGMLPTTRLVL